MRIKNNLLLISILFLSVNLSGQIRFKPMSTYITGTSAKALVVADINGDGRDDVAVSTSILFGEPSDFRLLIYYQGANGLLQSPIVYYYPTGEWSDGAISIDAGDLNNDSKKDIILAEGDSITIFYQQDPTHFSRKEIFVGVGAEALKIGDLNNDGLNDIALTRYGESLLSAFYQDSIGNLESFTYPCPKTGGAKLEIRDINNDNLNDVVLYSSLFDPGVYFFLQNTNGKLDYPYNPNGMGAGMGYPSGMAIGYLNNDTKYDIATCGGGNYPNARLSLYMQKEGSFDFDQTVLTEAYDIPVPAKIFDLNCDGRNEIIIAHDGWHAITYYEQDQQGNFKDYTRVPTAYGYYDQYSMDIGDLNGDGRPDIAIASGNLIIHFNDSRPLPSDTTYPRKAVDINNYTFETEEINQYVDTINSMIITTTDSTRLIYHIADQYGWEYAYEQRDGFTCSFYVKDSTLIDSVYIHWIDTVSIEKINFYHHVEPIGTTGYKDLLESKILIYPIPASEEIYVEIKLNSADYDLVLINLSGINVFESRNVISNTYTLDVGKLPRGIYFLKITINKLNYFKKVILN